MAAQIREPVAPPGTSDFPNPILRGGCETPVATVHHHTTLYNLPWRPILQLENKGSPRWGWCWSAQKSKGLLRGGAGVHKKAQGGRKWCWNTLKTDTPCACVLLRLCTKIRVAPAILILMLFVVPFAMNCWSHCDSPGVSRGYPSCTLYHGLTPCGGASSALVPLVVVGVKGICART